MHTITRMLIWENVSILNINGIEMSIFDVSITATMTGKLLNVEELCIELPSRIKMRVTQQTEEIFACTGEGSNPASVSTQAIVLTVDTDAMLIAGAWRASSCISMIGTRHRWRW